MRLTAASSLPVGPQPTLWWNVGTGKRLEQRPLLTTEAVIVDKPEDKSAPAMPGGGMEDF